MFKGAARECDLDTCVGAAAAVLLTSLAAFSAASSPVADAAMKGDEAAVRALILQKADVNAPQADGATAMQWAAYNNNLALADILIAAGAERQGRQSRRRHADVSGVDRGSAPMIDRLLKAGADPNERWATRRDSPDAGFAQRQAGRDQAAAGSQGGRQREGQTSRHHAVDVGRGTSAMRTR